MTIDVKKIRGRLELTQDEFAKRLDVTRQAVSNWEMGRPMEAKTEKLIKMVFRLEDQEQ